MALQYDNPNPLESASLRTQRMTADESRAVIALWQQERVEQTGLTDRPAVPDVAEGLDIPIEEVQRLLAEVRARRLEEERALAQEQELSEVRLAEEERRLAEIRRQRAELRREQAEGGRRQASRMAYVQRKQSNNPVSMVVATILFLFWLWWAFTLIGGPHRSNPFDSPPASAGCVLTMPDGTSQPCGPDYYRAHPEAK